MLRYLLTETVHYEPVPRRMPVAEEKPLAPEGETPIEGAKPVLTSEQIDKEVEGLIAKTA